jgi:hypothetical protein
MRAAPPAELNYGVTERARLILSDYLLAVANRLGRPVGDVLELGGELGVGIDRLTGAIADRHFDVSVCVWALTHMLSDDELVEMGRALSASTRYLALIEHEPTAIPAGPYSRLRSVAEYLAVFPGARLLERRVLDYGGDRSFAVLIEFPIHGQ